MANVVGLKRTVLATALMLVVAFGVMSSQHAQAAEQGADTVGLVNPASAEWHLQLADGSSNNFYFGVGGDIPIVGDWNCDGVSTPGMWRQSDGFAYLRNSNSMGAADIQFTFGAPGDIPIAGDFNGDGCDTLGVYRSGRVFIANQLGANDGFFAAEYDFFFGNPGDKPFVGDFDGDGFDTIGLRRESSGFVYFTNSTGANLIAPTDASFFFGQGGDKVVSGDWTFSGFDTVGIWRATDQSFYLNYANELAVADEVVQFGNSAWIPVTGKFSGTPVFPPLAINDVIELAEGGVVEGDVALNDVSNVPVSPNELPSTLDVALVSGPSYGIVELGDDGLFTYTHDGSENHTDSFTYRITDSNGLTAEGVVTVNIAPSNDNAPQVTDLSVSVDEGQTVEVAPNDGLLSTTSDLDVPPDVLVAELVIPTSFGTVSVNEDGSFSYTHNDSEEHSDAFVYRVFDGVNYSADAVATIIVNPVNDNAPFGVGSSVLVDEGGLADVVAADGLLVGAGDDDVPAGTLSAVLADAPEFGSVAVAADGSFSYTHDDSENHVDGFTFVVSDGELTSDPYPVEVTVTPVNDNTPSVDGLSFVGLSAEGALLTVDAGDGVLSVASDDDLPGDTLTAELVTGAGHGVVTVDADGSFTYAHDGSENHADSFTVAVRDGDWVSVPAAVVISVTPVNDNAPEGGADTYATGAETDVFEVDAASGVLFNDTDADVPADELTAVLVSGPSLATAFTLNPDGSFSYDFDETGEVFEDSFTYQASDGTNTSADTTVNLTITPVNDNAPFGVGSSVLVDEGGLADVVAADGLLVGAGDDDVPAGTLSAVLADAPEFGSVAVAADGSFSYTHDDSENHVDGFTFVVSDGELTSDPYPVEVTVTPVNDNTPTVDGLSFVGLSAEGAVLSVAAGDGVLSVADDADLPGDELTALLDTSPDHGTVVVDASGGFSYTHDGSENHADSFTVVVTDGVFTSIPAAIVVSVIPVNDNAPDAGPDAYTAGPEDQVFEVAAVEGVLINDTDADVPADELTVELVSGPSLATAFTLNADGSFSYDFDEISEVFEDSFTYRAFDGVNYSADTTVDLIITPVNDNAPAGVADTYAAGPENAVLDVDAASGVLENDADDDVPADELTAVLVAGPDLASAFTLNADGSFSYDFDEAGELFEDSFTYQAFDGTNYSGDTLVSLTIDPVNDNTPSVDGLSFVGLSAEGAVLSVDAGDGVLSVASDDDLPGDTLTAELVTGAGHGVVTVDADGSFTYAHDGSENHADSFTVAVRDGDWVSVPAAVVISVTPVNDNAPEGGADTYATGAETDVFEVDAASGVLFNDTDADVPADELTAVLVSGPSLATAFTLNPDGSFSYDFDETGEVFEDSFTYQASDGTNTSADTTVNLTITPVNDNAPTAGDDAHTLDEGAALVVVPLDGVLGNDEDADLPVDYTLTASVATGPDFGTLSLAADGSFTYTHNGSENHADSFTYTTSDGANTSDPATVALTINPVNDAPVAADTTGTINENSDPGAPVATVDVTDPDNETHTFAITAGNDLGKFTVDTDGAVTVVAGSDFETEPTSYLLTVEASDAEPLSDTATVAITIVDVNEAPTLTLGTAYDVDENSAVDASINGTTPAASDVDAGDTLTFSIGTGSDVVAIDPSSGALTVSGALDHELTPTVEVEVIVTDLAGLDASETITLTVNDVDEAPVIEAQTLHIDENSVITDVVGTVVAEDPEGAALTYGIVSGNALGVFAIDTATGVIRIADDGCMDFETCTVTYSLEVQVTDPSTQFTSAIVTVEIDDVNEDPTIVVGSSYNVDENSAVDTVVTGDAIDVTDLDAGDTAAYSITDGSTVLKINGSTGVLSVNDPAGLDHEGIGDVTVEVTVTDSGGKTDLANVVVTVNDINDAPEITMGASYAVPENSPLTTPVTGDLPITSDEDLPANGLVFSIAAGNDLNLFAIDPGDGALSVNGALNHETTDSYDLTIRVTDNGTPAEFAEASITVDITDVNEVPVMTVDAAGYTVAENSPADTALVGQSTVPVDPSATDVDDADTQTWSIVPGGTGDGLFGIDPATGALDVAAALNHETGDSYTLIIRVTDSGTLFDEETVTITVSDVNEAPVMTVDTGYSVDEDAALDAPLVGTAPSAADPDDADTQAWSITPGGTGDGLFGIDPATGALDVAAALNHEAAASHTLIIRVTDSGDLFDEETVTITIGDVNEAPVMTVAAGYSVDEDAALDAPLVGTAPSAADPDDADTQAWSITPGGTGDGLFGIDPATGALDVAAALNHETGDSYTLIIRVTDSGTLFDEETVTITVSDVNEAPVMTVDTGYSVDEDAALDAPLVGTAPSAADPDDADTQAWSITPGGTGDGLFGIDPATGALDVAAALNHEAAASHTLIIRVTDSGDLFDEETVTITIGDVNEAPVMTVAAGYSVDEDAALDAPLVGTAPSAADPDDADTQAWSITPGGTGDGLFGIDPATGALDVAAALNHETGDSYTLIIRVTDSGTLFDEETVTITVSDVNEAPVMTVDTGYSVDEDAALDAPLVGTAPSAADPDDADTQAWSITPGGTGDGLFGIDPATGALDVAAALNHEAAASHTLIIRVTDSGDLFDEETVTITIGDVNEAPVMTVAAGYSVDEDAALDAPLVGTAPSAADPDDADTQAWSITPGGTGDGLFGIDPATGALDVAAALNHETGDSYTLIIRVTDSGTLFDEETVTITIGDVNEAPVMTVDAAGYTVPENSAIDTAVVGQSTVPVDPSATDPDDADTEAWTIEGGTGAALFGIDPNTGALDVAGPLNHEADASYTLTIRVIDGGTPGLFDEETVTITVSDVNEAPVVVADQVFEVPVDSVNTAVVADVEATDVDDGDVLTYGIIAGNTNGTFTILADGIIKVANQANLVLDDAYDLLVKVTDSGGLTDEKIVRLIINRSPVIADQGFSVPENSTNTTVVDSIVATDPDGHALTWTVTGGTGDTIFAVNETDGEITVTDEAALDFETGDPAYTLDVTVTDAGVDNLASSAVITITESDVNEAPVMTVDPAGYSVDEDALTATPLTGTQPSAADVDAGDTQLWSIESGTGMGVFAINTATGALSADVALDHETTPSYDLTIRVTDGGTLFDEKTIAVTVNDIFEGPVTLTASSDNEIDAIYVDGVAITPLGDETLNPSAVDVYTLADAVPGSIIAVKAHNFDLEGWAGVQVDSDGTSYGTNATDGFRWYIESNTVPATANADPGADPVGVEWYQDGFNDTGWSTDASLGTSLAGLNGFASPSPVERILLSDETVWIRIVVPNP